MDDSSWVPDDLTEVTLDGRREIDFWTKTLGATEQDLKDAILNVGSNADDVRRFLGRKDPTPPTVAG